MGQRPEKARGMVPRVLGEGCYTGYTCFPQPGTVTTLAGWWPLAKPAGPSAPELLLGLITSVPHVACPASPDSQKRAGLQPTPGGLRAWHGGGLVT